MDFAVAGGDFARAGVVADCAKEALKRVGVDSGTIRRATIAVYEAETNVVVHAYRGTIRIMLDTDRIDVEVTDEGPGIPDIGAAMREGFSTASPAARELGFGAGMGLPNIRKNTDRFVLDSVAGKSTRLSFTIYLKAQEAAGQARHSMRVAADTCRQCLRCLRCCPTNAIRVRDGKPTILEHLCVDDPACIGVCETGALSMSGSDSAHVARQDAVLVVQPSLLVQFGPQVGPQDAIQALRDLGYGEIYITGGMEEAFRKAVLRYVREEAKLRPVISPACPAVRNLIQLKFPALCDHVAPFLSPVEAAQVVLSPRPAVFVALCPCQFTNLTSGEPWSKGEVISPSALLSRMSSVSRNRGGTIREKVERTSGSTGHDYGFWEVSGVQHVMSVLTQAEKGLLSDVDVVEPFLCDQGCFGSPLLPEDPFLARSRWRERGVAQGSPARPVRRACPLLPRPGMRLDPDMAKAIQKLSRMDALVKSLPGRDCCQCGAPTCRALAEDIVLGRATEAACVYLGTENGGQK
jgi:anti-sigma regulatory factor (Ser/Thr protein kinase)